MTDKCPSCGSCGMPLEKPELHGGGNPANPYCVYCTDESGTLLPYETVLEQNTNFYMDEQGLDKEAARTFSIKLLSTLPAWKSSQGL